jgi:hypothetical protein
MTEPTTPASAEPSEPAAPPPPVPRVAPRRATPREVAILTASVSAGTAFALNVAYYFLSASYFGSHPLPSGIADTSGLSAARLSFAVLTVIVASGSFLATIASRLTAHVLAVLLGVAALVAGIESVVHHMPSVMTAVLLSIGALLPVLAYFSWNRSRAAWAYLCSITAVFGIVTFFGAPKVRNVLDVGFWTAMMIPGLMFIAVGALAMCRSEYRANVTDAA